MIRVRKRDRSLLSNAVSLILCGLLAGLVVAAAAFPMIAMSGLAAKASADTFDKLPSHFQVLPAPQTSYLYASDGKTRLAQIYDEFRVDTKLADVAPVMRDAMVAAEDLRFYDHNGVDIKGVARAFVANQQTNGEVAQGASTLTMQYVRQVISYSAPTGEEVIAATERTAKRKFYEIKYAIALEKRLNKDEILERYLNIASFGHSAYGIFAASQVYFNKHPRDLSLAESALLAGLLQAPTSYNPATEEGRPKAEKRREYVLNQMIKMKKITEAERDEAMKVELKVHGSRPPRDCTEVQRPELGAGFFCDYLVRWWREQAAFGVDAYERENRLRTAGYHITTTLDIPTQAAAFKQAQQQSSVDPSLQVKMGDWRALMLAAVRPGKGYVEALATNRHYSNDQSGNGANTNPGKRGQKGNWPNTTVPVITGGGEVNGFQGGSIFKVFTVAAALEKGYPLDYPIDAKERAETKFPVEFNSDAACPGTGFYCPKNSGGQAAGVQNMWSAFSKSVNTYFVPLEERVGADRAVDVAKRLGIGFRSTPDPNDDDDAKLAKNASTWGSFTLGVSLTTPLEVANAYATLAADGNYCAPTPVMEIRDKDGNLVEGAGPNCKNVLSPEAARGSVDVARCPVGDRSSTSQCASSGTAPYVRNVVGKPVAGKTGTTDREKNATFVAMTPHLAVAGFLTDPDWPETNREMKHPPVNYAVAHTLKEGTAGDPGTNFTPPNKATINGNQIGIPNVRCQSVGSASSALRRAGFEPKPSRQTVASDCPAGTVAETEPANRAPKGAAVVINISKGGGTPGGPEIGPGRPGPGGPGGGGPPPPGRAPADCLLPFGCLRGR